MNSASNDKLDLLIEQVGRLTEGLTEIKVLIYEQAETAERQAAVAERQAAVAERQSVSIDRLTAIVETLVQRQ